MRSPKGGSDYRELSAPPVTRHSPLATRHSPLAKDASRGLAEIIIHGASAASCRPVVRTSLHLLMMSTNALSHDPFSRGATVRPFAR